jgi:hypothetical protein
MEIAGFIKGILQLEIETAHPRRFDAVLGFTRAAV